MTVRVKICGITRAEDAELAIRSGADILGLNFYPPSPRALTLEQARRIRRLIGNRCEVAGVFVNAERSYINQVIRELKHKLDVRTRLVFERPLYWLGGPLDRDGPFCQVCFDADVRLARLQKNGGSRWNCRVCGAVFD